MELGEYFERRGHMRVLVLGLNGFEIACRVRKKCVCGGGELHQGGSRSDGFEATKLVGSSTRHRALPFIYKVIYENSVSRFEAN